MGEVISIFSRQRTSQAEGKKEISSTPVEAPLSQASVDFEAISRQNAEKARKIAQERGSANKKVLRSYRIK